MGFNVGGVLKKVSGGVSKVASSKVGKLALGATAVGGVLAVAGMAAKSMSGKSRAARGVRKGRSKERQLAKSIKENELERQKIISDRKLFKVKYGVK